MATPDGTLRAEDDGRPSSAKSVAAYVDRTFGDRLGEARGAMERLAASLPPAELNRVGFQLYEHFRPEVPEGVNGWGAKGELKLASATRRGLQEGRGVRTSSSGHPCGGATVCVSALLRPGVANKTRN